MRRVLAAAVAVLCSACGEEELPPEPAPKLIGVTPTEIDFGEVSVGTFAEELIRVRNLSNDFIDIVPDDLGAEFAIQSLEPAFDGEETRELVVRFTPAETSRGLRERTLTLRARGLDAQEATIKLSGLARFHDLSVVDCLDFGEVAIGDAKQLTTTVINETATAYDAVALQLEGSGFSIVSPESGAYALPAAGSAQVTIQFSPPTAGAFPGAMIHVPCERCPGFATCLTAVGADRKYEVSPTTLAISAFGGAGAEGIVTVRNTGNVNLELGGASLTEHQSYFAVSDTAGTLAPGAERMISVTFSPPSAGAVSVFNTQLVVPATGLPPQRVAITGTRRTR